MPRGVYPRTEVHREICRCANLGREPWNKGVKGTGGNPPHFTGEKSSRWIDGRSLEPSYRKEHYKIWRENNRDKIRLNKRKYVWLKRKAGTFHKTTIQKIYEDNIKLFGTLTCVYCFLEILFGNDTVDHVLPLSRGGNHKEKNLVIACRLCNSFKRDKLYEEVI